MYKYHKIETIFSRDVEGTKKLVEGKYRDEVFEYLKDNVWQFTEKIDGTNIRVHWDGHEVKFYGRTDKAQIPQHLMNKLSEMFCGEATEEVFEQLFGEKEMILFGEGYGRKIQNGGKYIPDDVSFILFDVYSLDSDTYLTRDSVEDIGKAFGIDVVPIVLEGTLDDGVAFVKLRQKSTIGEADMEGVVGRPKIEMKNRRGNRVICKIKCVDF